jgi:hypothetical protein
VGIFQDGNSDAPGLEKGLQAGEGFGELVGIAKALFKKIELVRARAGGPGFEFQADDGGLRSEIFQVRVQHPEKEIGFEGGLRKDEKPPVAGFVFEEEAEFELSGDEPEQIEAFGQLIQKAAEEEEQGFEGFDGMLEFKSFDKFFNEGCDAQWPGIFRGKFFPQGEGFRAQFGAEVGRGQGEKRAERENAPGLEDGEKFSGGLQEIDRQGREKSG